MSENADTFSSRETEGTSGRLKEKYQQIKAKAGDELSNVRERMAVYGEGAEEFIDSVGRYVKENPQRSVMIAGAVGLGLGVLVGLLVRGRR